MTRTSLNSDIKMKTVTLTQRSLYPIRRSVCSFVGRPSEAKRRDEQSLRLFFVAILSVHNTKNR